MRTSLKLISIPSLCLIAIAAVSAFSQQPSSLRGITPEDYYSFEFLTDPHISPNGKLVAYVVTKVDPLQNRRNSSVWMVATDGSHAPWQFTTSPQSTTSPRWSPDGQSLAFLSTRPTGETAGAGAGTSGAAAEQPRAQIYLLS